MFDQREDRTALSNGPKKKTGLLKKLAYTLTAITPFFPEIVWEKVFEAVVVAVIGGIIYGLFVWIWQG